jgi:hypothetical protein
MNLVEAIAQAIAYQKEPTSMGWAFYAAAVKQMNQEKR